MTNIPDLYEVRIGKEISTDAWGTAVAQTHKVMGITDVSFTPIVESVQIKDRRASLAPGYNSVPRKVHATGTISGYADFEYIPHWMDALFGAATPTADTEYTYAYAAPLATAPTPQVYTIAYGNAADVDSVKSLIGATMTQFQLSGSAGGDVTYTANFIGRSVDTDTFDSAAEADSVVTTMRGCDWSLYIDPSSDAVGTTAIATTWMDFDLNINTNRQPFWYLGNCEPGNYRPQRWETSLRLGLEVNATSMAYLDSILNTSTATYERVVRMTATNGVNSMVIDFNGVALEAPQYVNDMDGVATINLMLMGQYNSTLANHLKVNVVNTIASMP